VERTPRLISSYSLSIRVLGRKVGCTLFQMRSRGNIEVRAPAPMALARSSAVRFGLKVPFAHLGRGHVV
jgi:hypothetical protein